MLLWTDVPVAAQVMAVHPYDAFFKGAQVEIGVGGTVEIETAFEEEPTRRAGDGGRRGWWRGGGVSCRRGGKRQVEGLPIHQGHTVECHTIRDALAIDEVLGEIDMPHVLHQDLEHGLFGLWFWQFNGPMAPVTKYGVDKLPVKIDQCIIMRFGNGEVAAFMADEPGTVEDHTARLVKGFHGTWLRRMFRGGQVIPKRGIRLHGEGRNGHYGDRSWHVGQRMAGITSDEVAKCEIFGRRTTLLVDGRIIVIARDIRLKLGGRKRVGACREAEIG